MRKTCSSMTCSQHVCLIFHEAEDEGSVTDGWEGCQGWVSSNSLDEATTLYSTQFHSLKDLERNPG